MEGSQLCYRLQMRKVVRDEMDEALRDVDALITPTTPATAFKIGDHSTDPLELYRGDLMTVNLNLAGWSHSCPSTDSCTRWMPRPRSASCSAWMLTSVSVMRLARVIHGRSFICCYCHIQMARNSCKAWLVGGEVLPPAQTRLICATNTAGGSNDRNVQTSGAETRVIEATELTFSKLSFSWGLGLLGQNLAFRPAQRDAYARECFGRRCTALRDPVVPQHGLCLYFADTL